MSKEKKKQASLSELRNGSCLLLLFSPLIISAYFTLLSSTLNYLGETLGFTQATPDYGFGAFRWILFISLFVMTYVLWKFIFRWRRLALFIKRIRDEYFRILNMQENMRASLSVESEEISDNIDINLAHKNEQQRMSQQQ